MGHMSTILMERFPVVWQLLLTELLFVLGNDILTFALLSNLHILLPFTCSEIRGSYWRDMFKGESFL